MRTADDAPDGCVYDAIDQLRHDLISPLTSICARAYLLGRTVQRAPELSETQRARCLEEVAAIERAVHEMVTVVDGVERRSRRGPLAATGRRPRGS